METLFTIFIMCVMGGLALQFLAFFMGFIMYLLIGLVVLGHLVYDKFTGK